MLGEVQNATRAVLKDLESNTSAKLFHFNEFCLRLFYSTESQQTTIFLQKLGLIFFNNFLYKNFIQFLKETKLIFLLSSLVIAQVKEGKNESKKTGLIIFWRERAQSTSAQHRDTQTRVQALNLYNVTCVLDHAAH